MNVLNPSLYARLQQHFARVRVADPGSAVVLDYAPDWTHRRGRLRARVVSWGETYHVSCPFCSDTRQRLAVNHHWAVRDKRTRDDMLHLATCFNEECLSTRIRQQELHSLLFPEGTYGGLMPEVVKPAKPTCTEPPPMVLPAGVPLETLDEAHPARQYLEQRGFHSLELSSRYGLLYSTGCYRSHPRLPDERIIIPIWGVSSAVIAPATNPEAEPTLLGWQARAIGPCTGNGLPKYLSAAGMHRSRLLYGLPHAIATTGPVVLVEGPADAWKVGLNALALIGKSISTAQVELLKRHFHGRTVVVLLDADEAGIAAATDVCTAIRRARAGAGDPAPVVAAQCPTGRKDPGECTSDEIARAVRKALRGRK